MSEHDHPASVADGVARPLDARVVVTWQIAAAVAAAVLTSVSLITVLVVAFGTPLPAALRLGLLPLGWLAFAGGLAGWALGWPRLRYRHVSYRVFSHGIEIHSGVIWRTVTQVPKTRVQHTDVSRGPIERAFGLATLTVYTAGTEHASVSLGGLELGQALRIRDHLIPAGGDDAV